MQRLHFLRWLALAIAVLSLQCLESLSDDCTKTLTCGDQPHATLDAQCKWRFPDGGIWEGGPHRTAEKRWVWPDGRISNDDFGECEPQLDGGSLLPGDGGGIGGVEGNCNDPSVACDAPLLCDTVSGRCVTCLDNSQCVGVTDPSLGPLPVCDQSIHACVACLRRGDCPMGTGECKTDGSDPARNQCVQCLNTSHCPVNQTCDTATNECAARCTGIGQCQDPKPICSIPPGASAGLCVECIDNSTCGGGTPQCNTATKQCVPCVGVGATTGACTATQVCNALNQCVECVTEAQCGGAEKPLCDTARNKCVGCFNSAQCTSPTASRCNTADSVCAACTSDVQCESDLPYCVAGRCVSCRDDSQCGGDRCDTGTGTCVNCLTNGDCGDENNARCDTSTHTCTGCNNTNQCGPRFGVKQLCRVDRGACVECLTNVECSDDAQASRCDQNSGLCAPCRADNDCAAVEGKFACAGGNGNAGRCVQCTDNADCTGNPAGPACKVSAGGSSAPINTCVQCVADADCPSAAAARCVANQCVACADDANCAHVAGAGVCDTSVASPVCVQCTGPKRAACGQNVCNSLTKVCTNFGVGSADICETCVSDAHCPASQRCALQVFESSNLGYFCFPQPSPGETCATSQAPFAGATSVDTIDGQDADLCLLRFTTCAAFVQSGRQACDDDLDCGASSLDDGRCDTDLGICSVPCSLAVDCPGAANSICQAGICR